MSSSCSQSSKRNSCTDSLITQCSPMLTHPKQSSASSAMMALDSFSRENSETCLVTASNSSTRTNLTTPIITTTAPTPPTIPKNHPLHEHIAESSLDVEPAVGGSKNKACSNVSRLRSASQFTFSKISRRSSRMLQNKKLVGLSSILSSSYKGSTVGLNSVGDKSDSISIGKKSLELKAALKGKFLVKVSFHNFFQ